MVDTRPTLSKKIAQSVNHVSTMRGRDISIVKLSAAEVERTLEALAESPTLAEAARRLGISRQAIYKRLQSRRVVQALSAQQRAMGDALVVRLLSRADAVLQTLDETLQARALRPRELAALQLRSRTALAVLDRLLKLISASAERTGATEVVDDF